MNAGDHLLECIDQIVSNVLLGFDGRWGYTDVVDTLEDHGIFHTGLSQDVPIDPSKGVWSVTIRKDSVTSGGLIVDRDIRSR